MKTNREFVHARKIILESLLERLKVEELLTESQIKHIEIAKALTQQELFDF